MKRELKRIKTTLLQDLIKLLDSKTITKTEDGDEIIPTNKELAKELDISVSKCNEMLKKLRDELNSDFDIHPLNIKNVYHEIIIWVPLDERKGKNEKFIEDNSRFTRVKLPFTPRIGETIDLHFLNNGKFKRGTIYDINHGVDGQTQKIEIYVDVIDNIYKHWQKLKRNYED